MEMDLGKKSISITVSMGLASALNSAYQKEVLFHAADEALYEAKESGKNQLKEYVKETDPIINEE